MYRRGRTVIFLVMVLLFAGAGVALRMYHESASESQEFDPSSTELSSSQSKQQLQPEESVILGEERRDSGSDELRGTWEGEPTTTTASGEVTVDSVLIRLAFVDIHSKTPAPSVPVEVMVFGVGDDAVSVVSKAKYSTGTDGFVNVEGPAGAKGLVAVGGEGWRFPVHGSIRRSTSIFDFSGDDPSVRIEVERYVDVSLRVSYSDGLPYGGMIFWHSGSQREEHEADSTGNVVIEVGAHQKCVVEVRSKRPGFGHVRQQVDLPALSRNSLSLTIELPEVQSDDGALVVDLSVFPSDSRFAVLAESQGVRGNRTAYRVAGVTGGTTHTTDLLPPAKYRVLVQQEITLTQETTDRHRRIAWRSEWLDVPPRTLIRVVAAPLLTGSVRAQIVRSSDNTPLSPAVAREHSGAYIDWETASRRQPGFVRSDEISFSMTDRGGNVLIAGLIPGLRTLAFEAPGHEVVVVDAVIQEGQEIDLGTVALSEAVGTIEVVIANHEPDAEYTAYVLQPGGTRVIAPATFSRGTYTIEGLPLRRYTVALGRVGGGVTTRSQNVTLTHDAPRARLEYTFQALPQNE